MLPERHEAELFSTKGRLRSTARRTSAAVISAGLGGGATSAAGSVASRKESTCMAGDRSGLCSGCAHYSGAQAVIHRLSYITRLRYTRRGGSGNSPPRSNSRTSGSYGSHNPDSVKAACPAAASHRTKLAATWTAIPPCNRNSDSPAISSGMGTNSGSSSPAKSRRNTSRGPR